MGGASSHLVGGGENYPCFIRESASDRRRDGGGQNWEVGIKVRATAEIFYPPSYWPSEPRDQVRSLWWVGVFDHQDKKDVSENMSPINKQHDTVTTPNLERWSICSFWIYSRPVAQPVHHI